MVRVRGRKSFVRPNNLRPAAYLLISTTKSRPFYRRSFGRKIKFLFPHSLGSKHNEMLYLLSFSVRERNRISFYSLERQQRTTNFLSSVLNLEKFSKLFSEDSTTKVHQPVRIISNANGTNGKKKNGRAGYSRGGIVLPYSDVRMLHLLQRNQGARLRCIPDMKDVKVLFDRKRATTTRNRTPSMGVHLLYAPIPLYILEQRVYICGQHRRQKSRFRVYCCL